MKRLLPALLSVLLFAGCSSSAPTADAGEGEFESVYGTNSPEQGSRQPEQETDKPLHACTWNGDEDSREDIRIFGPSEEEPFTKVEFIQYVPSKIDFAHENEEDVQAYLEDVKEALVEQDGTDPSILDVTREKGYVKLVYTCSNLEELQSVHSQYMDDTVSHIYETFSGMQGTATCDGQPVKRPEADISDFDKDMNTIHEWISAHAADMRSYMDGTMDPDAALNLMDSTQEIDDLIEKWKYNTDLLDDGQKQTFEEARTAYGNALLGV